MNYDLFGASINVWLDAFIRVNIIVLLMTVVVMALIYLGLLLYFRAIGGYKPVAIAETRAA